MIVHKKVVKITMVNLVSNDKMLLILRLSLNKPEFATLRQNEAKIRCQNGAKLREKTLKVAK